MIFYQPYLSRPSICSKLMIFVNGQNRVKQKKYLFEVYEMTRVLKTQNEFTLITSEFYFLELFPPPFGKCQFHTCNCQTASREDIVDAILAGYHLLLYMKADQGQVSDLHNLDLGHQYEDDLQYRTVPNLYLQSQLDY